MERINVLEDAQDIVLIKNLDNGNHIYAVKPSLDTMKQFYEQSISNPDDKNILAFKEYWKFDKEEGIKGSSIFLALRFDKLALRPNGLWIPGLLEAKVLDSKGKLENGVYRNYGIVIYNDDEPNKQMAEALVPQAKGLGLKHPLIVPFSALDYAGDQNKKYGIKLCLLNSRGIIQAKKAQNKINSLDYQGNSGVQGLYRASDGDWGAGWSSLDGSYAGSRVDWVCGETTRKILEKADKERRTKKR